jgi:hypothetical protein
LPAERRVALDAELERGSPREPDGPVRRMTTPLVARAVAA